MGTYCAQDQNTGREADEHGAGAIICAVCEWHQSRGHDDCERCGESPASIAETAADHEATQRADRWF